MGWRRQMPNDVGVLSPLASRPTCQNPAFGFKDPGLPEAVTMLGFSG
jgi:hypothetical protein